MTIFFVDTSALAKCYLVETGSSWVQSWIEPLAGNTIIICDLTPVEFFSLLVRRHSLNNLTAAQIALLQHDFLSHITREYISILLDGSVMIQARNLVMKHQLRPPDAIQLASAMQARAAVSDPIQFICADKALLTAAASESFSVDDPNLHP